MVKFDTNYSLYVDFRAEIDVAFKEYQNHLNDKKLIKDFNYILEKYNPEKFNDFRKQVLSSQIDNVVNNEQNKINKKIKLKGNDIATITVIEGDLIKDVSNRGNMSDGDRIKKYHKQMVKVVKDLEAKLNEYTREEEQSNK